MTAANRAIKIEHSPKTQSAKHTVPPLPYDYTALELVIDAQTMKLHHDHHHASYVRNLNAALQGSPELWDRSALWLLLNPGKVPRKFRTLIRHNAGGHVNHSLFWKAMSPAGHGAPAPAGALAAAIVRDFGSLDKFKQRFVKAGEKLFGSGWVWLAASRSNGGKLKICTTNGHGNPLSNRRFPILLNDVWEHAYYLNYQNRRGDYLRAWWAIVNWEEAARRFNRSSDHAAERDWEDEGGTVRSVTS
jgi:Fe-Mn family superoxide dismutase